MRKVRFCAACKLQKASMHFVRNRNLKIYYDTCYDCRKFIKNKYMSGIDFGTMLSNTSDNLIKAGLKKVGI